MFINLETRINFESITIKWETSLFTLKHLNSFGNITKNFETKVLNFMFQQ